MAPDLAREEHPVPVEGQERVLELVEGLEVLRPADADRRPVVPVAPRHVEAVLDPDDPRVVAVDELAELRVVALEPDRLRDRASQLTPSAAESAVELHLPRPVVAAEHAGVRRPSNGTTALLKMLFEVGSRSRGITGFREYRQTGRVSPPGRSSHGSSGSRRRRRIPRPPRTDCRRYGSCRRADTR